MTVKERPVGKNRNPEKKEEPVDQKKTKAKGLRREKTKKGARDLTLKEKRGSAFGRTVCQKKKKKKKGKEGQEIHLGGRGKDKRDAIAKEKIAPIRNA